jgi:hypothetical protein
MQEKLNSLDAVRAAIKSAPSFGDELNIHGTYKVKCYEYEGGPLLWEDEIQNVVCTLGKNAMLDNFIAGSGFTQVGPYMGLISSVSWSATAAGDTMASHSGWTEAGSTNAPTFSARGTPAWSAASGGSKSTSAAVSFTMTGAGTLEGAFMVLGSGAVTTLMNTSGTLFSAGAFSGGAQAVSNGNVVTVSYSISI